MKPGALPCLLALVALAPAGAQVDTAEHNETFQPSPVAREQVEKRQIEVGPSEPAAGLQQEFVTVPVVDSQIRLPQNRATAKAPIDMTARTMPVIETANARVSTTQPAPAKFEKKFATPTVSRIQEGLTEAGRVKTTAVKPKEKGSILERINRFVFRRNPVEPVPAVEPAGGENASVENAATPAKSGPS